MRETRRVHHVHPSTRTFPTENKLPLHLKNISSILPLRVTALLDRSRTKQV